MKQLLILLSVLIIWIFTGCKKDDHHLPQPGNTTPGWTVYNTSNSILPDNQVNALAIDNKDVAWVGTAKGLVRISGDDWRVFTPNNTSLPSGMILSVTIEDNGTVWVGTDKGLARYNGSQWTVYTTANSVMSHNEITCLTWDPINKIVWGGSAGSLLKIDRNNHWENIEAFDDLVLSMAVDKKGALWLGTFHHFSFRGRIRKLQQDVWSSTNLDEKGYASAFPYSLAIDPDNNLVALLTGTSVKSVVRIRNSNWEEIPQPAGVWGIKSLLTEEDKIWVGGKTLSVFGNTSNPQITIPGKEAQVQTMALDTKGNKWLGTLSSGLAIYK